MAGEPYSKGRAQNLITILALDPVQGKVVAQLIEPDLFEGPLRLIAERCVKFWKENKTCPGPAHLKDLFEDITEKPDSRQAVVYKRILRSMQLLDDEINTEFVVSDLKKTSRRQRMKSVLLKVAEIAQAEQMDLDEGEKLLADFVRKREFQAGKGLRLTDVDKVIDFLDTHYSEFSSGVELLDKFGIVPSRGAVMLFLAPTRRGKSWFLCNVGKHAIMLRKNVLHLTLEMAGEETMMRYYQAMFAIPKHDGELEIFSLDTNDKDRYTGVSSRIRRPTVSFDSENIRKVLHRKINTDRMRRLTRHLVVERFPPRSLTMNQLRSYLDVLEATTGFIPDMIVLDYIGITSTDVNNPRISLGRNMEDFRAVCVERNAAGVTAQQSSKLGEGAFQVKMSHVAEDWSMIGTADVALTFSQTVEERARGLARLWVDKCRSEADNWGVIVTQNYASGQFALQGARLNREYEKYVRGLDKSDEEKRERKSKRKRGDDDDE